MNYKARPPSSSPSGRRRIIPPLQQALQLARIRLVFIACAFILSFTIITAKLMDLSLFSNGQGAWLENQQNTTQDTVKPTSTRADIIDRNGTILATSLPTVLLCANSKDISDPNGVAQKLMSILPDLDSKELQADLTSGKSCAVIRRHLTPKQYADVNNLGIVGLEFQPDEKRVYPAGNVTAHIVGYTDTDSHGLAGIEQSFHASLQKNIQPLALSIDLRAQNILQTALAQAMQKYQAIGSAGLIMDIKTGELLALVSLPDFDPQHPGDEDDHAKFNRASLGVYEMGSTFKIFTTALGINSGLINLGDRFNTIDPIKTGQYEIHDFKKETRWLNVAEIFTHSSNIGTAQMAERIGENKQREFFGTLGLFDKSPIELGEVGRPLIPAHKDWNNTTTMTVAFGHGIAVSAIQLASAVASIIGDGHTVTPTLLKQPENMPPHNDGVIVSDRTTKIMRGLMRLVVTHGTAKGADVAGYMLGGKTGTAEKNIHGRYSKTASLSSFIGAFPINAPRYLVFAMLDEPKGDTSTYGFSTGGWIAAPVVSHVVTQLAPILGISPMSRDEIAGAEQQLSRALGNVFVDGKKVDEGSHYETAENQ